MTNIIFRITYPIEEQRDLSSLRDLIRPHLVGPGRTVREVGTRELRGCMRGILKTVVMELELTTDDPEYLRASGEVETAIRRAFKRHDIEGGVVETLVASDTLSPSTA